MPSTNNVWACCRNHPKTMELLKRVSLFKSQKNTTNWKFEALATQMVIIGILLVLIIGFRSLSSIDANSAFMVSTTHSDDKICTNLTCGGLYCYISQPLGCEAQPVFLKLLETAPFCNSRAGCNWEAEIVTDSNYDNRSRSLFIMSDSGKISYFPPLEQSKRQFIDVTMYVTKNSDLTLVDWAISEDTHSASMAACGSSFPDLILPNSRCGAYNIYMANTVYTSEVKQKYQLESDIRMFWILNSVTGVYVLFYGLTWSYGEMLKAKKKANHRASD